MHRDLPAGRSLLRLLCAASSAPSGAVSPSGASPQRSRRLHGALVLRPSLGVRCRGRGSEAGRERGRGQEPNRANHDDFLSLDAASTEDMGRR